MPRAAAAIEKIYRLNIFFCCWGKTWEHKHMSHICDIVTFNFPLCRKAKPVWVSTCRWSFASQWKCHSWTRKCPLILTNSLALLASPSLTAHCLQSGSRFLPLDGFTRFSFCSLVFWPWKWLWLQAAGLLKRLLSPFPRIMFMLQKHPIYQVIFVCYSTLKVSDEPIIAHGLLSVSFSSLTPAVFASFLLVVVFSVTPA